MRSLTEIRGLLRDEGILSIVAEAAQRLFVAEQIQALLHDLRKWEQRPRAPAGVPEGGQFTPSDGSAGSNDLTPAGNLTLTSTRAYTGQQIETTIKLGKGSGKLGEAIVLQYVQQHEGVRNAKLLNLANNNYPVDIVAGRQAIEAKTGLVSNGPSAQKWRSTIGQPGKAETEWLRTASPEAKRAHNTEKMAAIMQRKERALRDLSSTLGKPVTARTVTTIINPDTRTADIHSFDGFHWHLRWNNEAAKNAYIGSYKY